MTIPVNTNMTQKGQNRLSFWPEMMTRTFKPNMYCSCQSDLDLDLRELSIRDFRFRELRFEGLSFKVLRFKGL